MANNENLGASFTIDITNLKTGLNQANALIRESNSEFQAAAAGMDDWGESEEGVTAKLKNLNTVADLQRKKVDALQKDYDDLVANGLDPASKAAVDYRTKINKEKEALAKTEKQINEQEKALQELGDTTKKTGDETDKMGDKFSGLKKAGGIAAGAIAAIGAACVAAVGAFLGLAESTREYREDMAKLQTGFQTAGFSAEQATETYKDFFSILGEEDRSVEAVNHLAKLTSSQEELDKWTTICAGVWGTFGDSLPIEGLTEASNETAKTGKLTGVLADALNWAGVSEDEFQAKLDGCNSEQERAALITDTLNGLYSEAAANYKELNGDVMDAQRAQSELTDATAALGAVAEPIMTRLKMLAADLLTAITPFVELIGNGLTAAFNGAAGASDMLAEGLSGIVSTLLDKIMNILPTILNVIVKIVPSIIDTLLAQLPSILDMLLEIVTEVINALTALIPSIITAIVDIVPQLINSLIAAIPQLLQAAITFLMAIVQAIPTIVTNLVHQLPTIIKTILNALIAAIPQLIEAAIQMFTAIVDAIPVIIEALIVELPNIINTIITALINALPLILDGAIQMLMAIIEAIPVIIDALIQNLPKIISTITSTLISNLPLIIKAAVQLLMGLIKAIPQIVVELIKNMPQIISAIVSGLAAGAGEIFNMGVQLIKGLWDGIASVGEWIWEKISGFFGGIVDGIKDFFGIHSPSRLFRDEIGKNMALGIGEGFVENMDSVNKDIQNSLKIPEANVDITGSNGVNGISRGGAGVVVYQTNNYSQAHSRYELYKSKQATAAAVRLALAGA